MKRSTIGYFLMAVLLALSHITLADTTDEDASADILIMKPILFNGTELIKAFLDVEELDEECLTVKERGNPVTIITKYEKDNQKITANCSKGTLGTVIMEVRGQEEKTQEERIEQWLQILERLNISVDEQVEITWGGTDSKGRKLSLFCSGKWNSYLSNGLHHRR